MCSIMAAYKSTITEEKFTEALTKTASRGPDDRKVLKTGDAILGFERLSIMGPGAAGMQPFELNGNYVICNGELYGFEKAREELKEKGYTFAGNSDCEIILPLYEQYGVGMFEKLDAEFACVIYDTKNEKIIAARDPIGIRPLFYGYDKDGAIFFASEAKNLVGVVDNIIPFPPGRYMEVSECKGKPEESAGAKAPHLSVEYRSYLDLAKRVDYLSDDV
ncbi:MAG: asparagine synthetase B, partial [Lachnospiraceae bacterium]|nr:asparagine synthetase B [Lachnospiraceae bacterium]